MFRCFKDQNKSKEKIKNDYQALSDVAVTASSPQKIPKKLFFQQQVNSSSQHPTTEWERMLFDPKGTKFSIY